jgi:hypothetical protein
MSNTSKKPLRQNPYTTYRDPQTGKWIVVVTTEAQPQPSSTSDNEM